MVAAGKERKWGEGSNSISITKIFKRVESLT